MKLVSKRLSGSSARPTPRLPAYDDIFQLSDQQIEIALPLVVGRLPGAADRTVERTDDVRRADGLRCIDAVPT